MQPDPVDLRAVVEGDGPWLLLLHGFSHDHRYWRAQRGTLASSCRLVLADLRGHGGSPSPIDIAYGPVEHLVDVIRLLDRLGVASAHILGTHTGAGVGLLLALEHPDRVASLILEGAVIPGMPLAPNDAALIRMREIARDRGVVAARASWFEQPFFDGVRREANAAELREIMDEFSGAPWRADAGQSPVPPIVDRLGSLRQPVSLINGADDLTEFLDTARQLERELPHARRYLIPGAGAFPAWERPDAVTPLLLRILEEHD
ncbi:MAG TPA: alpha/beta fold hydrolase [Thermomicrobiales bacterium]|nr:alpha/beta fold hydrolase [Thermomicrobiales bacterium]HRA31952.1 alpha/beta fold hydrolase [Thermomicrobiales bacterium]